MKTGCPLRQRALELVIGDRLGNPSQQIRQLKAGGRVAPSSRTPILQLRLTAPVFEERRCERRNP